MVWYECWGIYQAQRISVTSEEDHSSYTINDETEDLREYSVLLKVVYKAIIKGLKSNRPKKPSSQMIKNCDINRIKIFLLPYLNFFR